jgi:hydroxymethylbilane synthase
MKDSLIIGTRGSKLALWQAQWVQKVLKSNHSNLKVEIHTIKTRGDKILDVPLAKVGGKGLFVKEIENALIDGRIDLAVHSMKDMPGLIPDGLRIGATPARESAEDVLISYNDIPFLEMANNAKIGTSSLRRAAQLRALKPDLNIQPLRGNLDTRLEKLKRERFDAIVLAAAGVKRLGLENRISEVLDMATMLPAVGQGALCIEIRESDPAIEAAVSALNDPETSIAISAERAFLNRLEGGCQTPIAAHAQMRDGRVRLVGMVASIDGRQIFKQSIDGSPQAAVDIGTRLADQLLDQGARSILDLLKESAND